MEEFNYMVTYGGLGDEPDENKVPIFYGAWSYLRELSEE